MAFDRFERRTDCSVPGAPMTSAKIRARGAHRKRFGTRQWATSDAGPRNWRRLFSRINRSRETSSHTKTEDAFFNVIIEMFTRKRIGWQPARSLGASRGGFGTLR